MKITGQSNHQGPKEEDEGSARRIKTQCELEQFATDTNHQFVDVGDAKARPVYISLVAYQAGA